MAGRPAPSGVQIKGLCYSDVVGTCMFALYLVRHPHCPLCVCVHPGLVGCPFVAYDCL